MSKPWIFKYLPVSSKEVFGRNLELDEIRKFLFEKTYKKKCLILQGPPGTGKTSCIYAIGNEKNCEIIELNASDFRNKDKIQSIVGNAINQQSLFFKQKIILIDEVDGLSGTKDRGGILTIVNLAKKSKFPIILTAQNVYESKFSSLRKISNVLSFDLLPYTVIFDKLKYIAEKEDIIYDESALKSLSRMAGGDLRAAINDLQTISAINNSFKKEDLDNLSLREKKDNIACALTKIFKSNNSLISLNAIDNLNEDIDKIMLWVDENLPYEYTNFNDLTLAYDKLSKANVFMSRIRRWQHWRFIIYAKVLISAGISVSKLEKNKNCIAYKESKRPLEIYIANMKYQKRKLISKKIAEKTHTSLKRAINSSFVYLQYMIKKDKKNSKNICEFLDLLDDEIAWLVK
ncbi:MAG: replication factor C large subunit [Nanoarchaeota archaeon]